ncbi:spore germination protein GerW family protein, partial [Butyricicoccus sp.]
MAEHGVNGLMAETMEKIRSMVDVNTIIGDPIVTHDGTTLIPISKVTFGFGSGGTDFKSRNSGDNAPLCFGGGGGAG